MKAMRIVRPRAALRLSELDVGLPGPEQVRIRVEACGVCRTDLHLLDGDLVAPHFPLTPGHEIVGVVEAMGRDVTAWRVGDRVGVPWLGWACGDCPDCRRGQENLCERAEWTGFTRNGGYAEQALAHADYCLALPPDLSPVAAAPLLCAGLIGYRTLRLAGPAERVGLYGFGAAAHIVAQIACGQGQEVYAFTRPGDAAGQAFARELGARWAGPSDALPPCALDAALIFAPVGSLVPRALAAVRKGGVVVCGGIHMSDIPSFPYALLWGERCLRSVANLTREDGRALLDLAPRIPIHTSTRVFELARANEALEALRAGQLEGAAVLVP